MKVFRIIGIFLVLLGVAMLATGSFHFKQRKKIVDTNTVDISTRQDKIVTWPRVAGIAVAIGGIVLIIIGEKGRTNSDTGTSK